MPLFELPPLQALPFAFLNVGPPEMIILAVIAVLLFGKRLPEVGRTVGRGIIEFKKGLAGIQEEIDSATRVPPPWRAEAPVKPPALADAEVSDDAEHEPTAAGARSRDVVPPQSA